MCVYCSILTGIPSAGKIQHKYSLPDESISDDLSRIGTVIFPENAKRKDIPLNAPKTAGTIQELADYLREKFWEDFGYAPRKWDMSKRNGVITYNTTGINNAYDWNGISSARADLAKNAFDYYEEIYGFTFTEDTSGNADISFSDNAGGAFSNHRARGGFCEPGQINIESGWAGWSSGVESYTYSTMIHEIGHSLGLGHLGNYNAEAGVSNYFSSARWANDSKLISAMSYISLSQNPYINDTYSDRFNLVMASADILALDDIYSADSFGSANAFTGDTVYGNNTTITEDVNIQLARMADGKNDYINNYNFTIVDGSGIDTFDFSDFTGDQFIDLRQSAQRDSVATTFYSSSVGGGLWESLFIAPGTVIENAIGGSGDDTLTGNSAANSLTGGGGNDTMTGGAGDDQFNISDGDNVITDFLSGADKIGIALSTTYVTENVGNNLKITFSNLSTVLLNNVQKTKFNSTTNFILLQNEAPANLVISTESFNENIAGGSAVATLSSTDSDSGDTHTYSLVSGTGDTDNNAFTVNSDQLKIKSSPDHETQDSYSIRLQTKDSGGLTFEKSFTLTVNDLEEPEAPTDLVISTVFFNENIAEASTVATLSTSDPDTGDTHTYSLVSGTGDTNNNAFTINGEELKIKSSPDYETQDSYSIRLQTKDSGGLTFEKSFTLTVNNLEEAPINLSVSASTFNENIVGDSAVATLNSTDPDSRPTHTYSLVSGSGDTDNNAFSITGDQLKIRSSPDYETQDSYSIRLQTKDSGGLTFEKSFTLTVNDLEEPEAPTDLVISTVFFNENIAEASTVATLSTSDPDTGDTHNYSLVSGTGDTDNNAFTIHKPFFFNLASQLKIKSSPDYETQDSYSIRLQTKDSGGLTFEKSFTLTVNDLNEEPINLSVSASTFNEGIAGGSEVATLNSTDSDSGDTHTYSLVSGTGDTDNNAFTINSDQLKIKSSPDYSTQDSYSVRLQTEDSGGLTLEKTFTFTVNDLDEGAPDVDGDGFVDGVSNYQMWTSSGGIDLTNKKGRKYSDNTSKMWDAIKAIQTDSGYSILLRGDRKKQGKYQIISANDRGVRQSSSSWKSALQMFKGGNEDIFDTDFNGNGQIGFIAPTAISLSTFSLNENISSGSVVSHLSSTDHDPDDTHIYSLVSGSGDTHNSAFSIEGDKLKTNASPDYETQSSYSIRLKTTDSSGGLSYEAPFTLNVNDLDEEINEDIIDKPTKFNKKSADKITNFNPSIDTLKIDIDSFGIDRSATFAVGKNKKNVKNKLAKKDVDFLYDQKKGDLYFNENGADKGFGDGGIIAIIKGAPDLTIQNIDFL